MQNFINKIKAQIPAREEGQGTVEYAVVLGVLVVAIFTAFTLSGVVGGVTAAVTKVTTMLNT